MTQTTLPALATAARGLPKKKIVGRVVGLYVEPPYDPAQTDDRDAFALGGRNAETATGGAANRAGLLPVYRLGMAAPAGTAPTALPPMEQHMPDGFSPALGVNQREDGIADERSPAAIWKRLRFLYDEAEARGDEERTDPASHERRWDEISERIEQLNAEAPATLADCVAKLSYLCGPNGIECGDRDDDVPSLRQVLAFIEARIESERLSTGAAAIQIRDADAVAIELFRRWIAAKDDADAADAADAAAAPDDDDAAAEMALERADGIEEEIIALTGGPLAMAIKAYRYIQLHESDWTTRTAAVRIGDLHSQNPHYENRLIASLLRDASKLVPEIAELAAPIVHEDAALINAEIQATWAMIANAKNAPRALAVALRQIQVTPAKTERGREIKDRFSRMPNREAEIRHQIEALAAACREPLPAGDAGLIEAERRLVEFEQGFSRLEREYEVTCDEESDLILPISDPAGDELHDFLIEEEAQGLAGFAAKLRYLSRNPVAIEDLAPELLDFAERLAGGEPAPQLDVAE